MSPNLLAQNIHTATCMNNFGDYRKLTSFFTTLLCIWGLIYKQRQCKKWGPKEAYAITDLSLKKKKKKIGGKMWAPGKLWPMHMNILEASGIGGAK